MQTIVVGGGRLAPRPGGRGPRRFGAAYSIRYSSTESGGCGTGTAFDADDDEALHSVGRPRGGIEVSARDDDGNEVPAGEVGELWLRSPTQMSGYWRDPEATAAAHHAPTAGCAPATSPASRPTGWCGWRAGPRRCSSAAATTCTRPRSRRSLAAHPAVAEVAVVPRPDPVMGEIGVAVVVPLDPAAPPTLDDLRAFLDGRVAAYKIPEAVRSVDELPLTPMQKVDRRSLAAAEVDRSVRRDGRYGG